MRERRKQVQQKKKNLTNCRWHKVLVARKKEAEECERKMTGEEGKEKEEGLMRTAGVSSSISAGRGRGEEARKWRRRRQ